MPEASSARRPSGRLPITILVASFGLAAAGLSAPAFAQFKWVGPDGVVSYGDRPPPGARPVGQDLAKGAAATSSAPVTDGLPYELRVATQRHPVTLYTTPDCQPCTQARNHLTKRGIPFSAREVRTQADAEAFRAVGFADLSFPALGVGRDRTTGFEAAGWDRLLDAAGYPKTSLLPPRWQTPRSEALARPESSQTPSTGDEQDIAAEIRQGSDESGTQGIGTASPEQPAIRF